MSAYTALPPENRPQDCWDWISPEEVTRMAMIAFQTARRNSRPPNGQRFVEEDMPYASREDFARNLALIFEVQIKTEAYSLGIGRACFEDEVRRFKAWFGDAPAHMVSINNAAAGS